MDTEFKAPPRQKKLILKKDCVSPQILDYYKRFGQHRDLEQYFLSRDAIPGPSNDARTEFSYTRCTHFEDDHSQCPKKSLDRKQYQSKSLNVEQKERRGNVFKSLQFDPWVEKRDETSQNSEEEKYFDGEHGKKQKSSKIQKITISDRSDYSTSKASLEIDDVQLDNSINKAVSPGSSITRKLEWDSLADVGYANAEQGRQTDQGLSTLEKMALKSQYKMKDNSDERNDPADIEMQNVAKMGNPNAQSTPIIDSENIKTLPKKNLNKNQSNIKLYSKQLKDSSTFEISYKDAAKWNIDVEKKISFDVQGTEGKYHRTHEIKYDPNVHSPREQNIGNISNKSIIEESTRSDKTFQKDDVLPKPVEPPINKEIQTTSKNGVSTSVRTQDTVLKPLCVHRSDYLPYELYKGSSVVKKSGKPKVLKKKISYKSAFKKYAKLKNEKNNIGTADTCPIKEEQKIESKNLDNIEVSTLDQENSARYGESMVSTTDSFEYMPGSVYQNNEILKGIQNIHDSVQKVNSAGYVTIVSSSSSQSRDVDGLIKVLEMSSSLGSLRNISSSINLIGKFAQGEKDPDERNRLIKRIVNVMVKNNLKGNSQAERMEPNCKISLQNPLDTNIIGNTEEANDIRIIKHSENQQQSDSYCGILKDVETQRPSNDQRNVSGDTSQNIDEKSSKSMKSVPVSLTYSEYLENKAKSNKSNEESTTKGETNVSERQSNYSKQTYYHVDNQNRKNYKHCSEVSGSVTTVFSSTSKLTSPSSYGDETRKSKSQEVFDEYQAKKKLEDNENKHRQLKREIMTKRKLESQLKKRIDQLSASPESANNTKQWLDKINDEILKLTVLKMKLENKNNPKVLKQLSTNINSQASKGKENLGENRNEQKQIYVKNRVNEQVYPSATSTESQAYPSFVPPLNMKNSSESTLSHIEEIPSSSGTYVKKLDSGISRSYGNRKSSRNNVAPKNDNDGYKRNTEYLQKVRLTTKPKSTECKNELNRIVSEMSQKASKLKNVPHRCKSEVFCCSKNPNLVNKIQLQNPFHSSSQSSFGLCPCCKNNLISSASSSASEENHPIDVTNQLEKLDKIFSKYQKCKVMQSFMKEYDNLILKYQLMKEARLANQNSVPQTHQEQTQYNSTGSHRELSSIQDKYTVPQTHQEQTQYNSTGSHRELSSIQDKHFRELTKKIDISFNKIKKSLNECTVNDINLQGNRKIRPDSATNDAKMSTETSQSQKVDRINSTSDKDSDRIAKVPLHFEPNLKKKVLIDANTSPLPTPKNSNENNQIYRVCEQVDANTSPFSTLLMTSESNKGKTTLPESVSFLEVSNDKDSSTSPMVTARMIRKVKKALSEEYGHIFRNYETVKNSACSSCQQMKSTLDTPSASQQTKTSKVNTINLYPHESKARKNRVNSDIGSGDIVSKKTECEESISSDTVVKDSKIIKTNLLCSSCKSVSITLDKKICSGCLKRKRNIDRLIKLKERKLQRSPTKPIAYNLIIESSDSILEETLKNKVSLEEVIIKVPKLKYKKSSCDTYRMPRYNLHNDEMEEKGSTDEQLKEFSSWNSEESSRKFYSSGSEKSSGKENNIAIRNTEKKYDLTPREFLEQRRPDFIQQTERRQECLRKVHQLRQQRDAERRSLVSWSMNHLLNNNVKKISMKDIESVARQHGILLPKSSDARVFKASEMVRSTARQYKKLPEVQNKVLDQKKQEYKKTNLLMADIFAKKLKERALKGVVNISHSSKVFYM